MSKKKAKTAAELIAELEKDPAYLEQRRQREEDRRRREQERARAEAPLVLELRQAGVPIDSVWDLVNSTNTHAKSLPILVDHLQRPYPDAVREGIARALAVPGARFAWPVLVKLYRQEREKRPKDGLAVAISNVADDETIDELVELARDPRHGESRLLLLNALERLRTPRARKALMDLGGDAVLQKEVQLILRRLRKTRT